jgi:transposase
VRLGVCVLEPFRFCADQAE